MEKNSVGLIVGVVITLVVGLALIDNLGDVIYASRTLSTASNESVTIASSTVTTAEDDVQSISYLGNTSHNFGVGTNISGVNINITRGGVITVNGAEIPDDTYAVTYVYEEDEYVVHNTSRILMPLMVTFFAIAILMVAILYVLKVLPQFK